MNIVYYKDNLLATLIKYRTFQCKRVAKNRDHCYSKLPLPQFAPQIGIICRSSQYRGIKAAALEMETGWRAHNIMVWYSSSTTLAIQLEVIRTPPLAVAANSNVLGKFVIRSKNMLIHNYICRCRGILPLTPSYSAPVLCDCFTVVEVEPRAL